MGYLKWNEGKCGVSVAFLFGGINHDGKGGVECYDNG